MDNTEYTIKKDEIRSLIAQKEYAQAVEIADTIDWRRVRSVMMLCTISDLYKINRRYEDAKNMLLLAYDYRPGGRSICYSLCELCIKMEEFVQAVAYYKEFVQAAPKDPDRYVLQYKLYEAQDVSLEERIEVLKELKQKEYREKWAYELAYLYHRIGQATLCVEECDELILWFGEGKYVYKAMELKMLHQPLSPSQQEKYEHRPDGIRVQENASKAPQNVVYPQPREQSQSYEQAQGYIQSQGYERAQGYAQQVQEQSRGYEQSQGYAQQVQEQPRGYEQSQGYAQQVQEQPRGYEQSQGYTQQVQEQFRGYEQSQGYTQQVQEQPRGYEQSQGYMQQVQEQSRGYEQSQGYTKQVQEQFRGYEQSQGYVQEQPRGYEQSQGYMQQVQEQSRGYEQSQGYEQSYAQPQGYEQVPAYEQRPSRTYEQPRNYEQVREETLPQISPEPEVAERFSRMQQSFGEQDFEDTQDMISAEAEQGNSDKTIETEIQVPIMDMGQYNTMNLQAEIAAGLQEVLEKENRAHDEITRSIIAPMLESDTGRLDGLDVEETDEDELNVDTGEVEETEVFFGETGEINSVRLGSVKEIVPEMGRGRASEIVPEMGSVRFSDVGYGRTSDARAVRPSDVGYGQASDARAVRPSDVGYGQTSDARAVRPSDVGYGQASDARAVRPSDVGYGQTSDARAVRPSDMGSLRTSDVNPVRPSDVGYGQTSAVSPVQSSDVGGDTKVFEIVRTKKDTKKQVDEDSRTGADSRSEQGSGLNAGRGMPAGEIASDMKQAGILPDVKQMVDATAELVMRQMRMENKAEAQAMIAQPPKELANVLSQESDGQISLVMPERETIEKQITGQMSIEDILAEWERIKQETAERRKAELQQRVLQQTGNMFTEFEAAVRDGLLEKLESEMDKELEEASAQGEPEDLGEIEELEEIIDLDEEARLQDVIEPQVTDEPKVDVEPERSVEAKALQELEIIEELETIGEHEAEPEPAKAAESQPEMADKPAKAEAIQEREAPLKAETAEEKKASAKPESTVEPAKFGNTEAAQAADEQKMLSEPQMSEKPAKAEAVEKHETPSEAEAAGKREAPSEAEAAGKHEAPSEAESAGKHEAPSEAESAGKREAPSEAESAGKHEAPSEAESAGKHEAPSEAEAAGKHEALSNAESVEQHEVPVNVESAVRPAKLGMTEAAQTAAKQKTPSEPQMAEQPVKAQAVEKRVAPSSVENREAPVVPQTPVKPAKSGMPQGLPAAVKPESFAEPEEYAPYDTEESADYIAEESVDTREAEGNYQPIEEQERPPVRKLTREERELYAPYIQSRSAREQLVKAIDNISMAANTGNIIITGDEGMNTITLAKNMIREVQMMDKNFSGKVAKISGQGLNQRNVKETLEQLKNGALIIEKASGIQTNTAAALAQFLRQDNVGIIIVLEDTKKAIARLFAENPRLRISFTAWMDVEALSNDTLASFGMKYARQMEYSIDDLGMLALHKRIEELQTIDHVVTVVEVKEIVDNAIRHASKKSLGHFMDILLAKRYDEEDMIILTEKDFGVKGGNSE